MNTLWIVVVAVVVIYLAYTFYAKRIDQTVIQANAKRATPAKMYMDGVDFMPASRNVLYGYHFKSIAAAGPIVGVITAANLFVLISFGDLLGVPILPPYYSLRLLPFVVPLINNWRRRMMRERDMIDSMF